MNNSSIINKLHALRFRPKAYPGKALLEPKQQRSFLNFLIRALGEDVFLIQTRLGLDIYYLTKQDKTSFITGNFGLFTDKNAAPNPVYYLYKYNGAEVLEFFDRGINQLSHHPQLFLSCCKKLLVRFKESGTHTALNQILYTSLNDLLNRLIKENCIPFASKIDRLRQHYEQPFVQQNDALYRLIQDFSQRYTAN